MSVSKKIPSRPDFVFCIQVFCTAYKKKTVWIYTSNGNSPITFPHTCLGKNYVFIQAAVKSKQSLILIISHLCFHITIIPSKQNYISKFCTTRSSHSRRLRDKISCWSSVQPKKENEFVKFQVDHSSSGQSIEWRALISSAMFCNILSSRYARHRETFPPFWGQFPVVDDM